MLSCDFGRRRQIGGEILVVNYRLACSEGFGQFLDFGEKRTKAEFLKKRTQPIRVDSLKTSFFPVDFDRNAIVEPDEAPRDFRLIAPLFDIFFFLPFEFVGMGENIFERSVLLEQERRAFGTDERNSGDIVGGVADHRLEIDHLIRADSPVSHQ